MEFKYGTGTLMTKDGVEKIDLTPGKPLIPVLRRSIAYGTKKNGRAPKTIFVDADTLAQLGREGTWPQPSAAMTTKTLDGVPVVLRVQPMAWHLDFE